MQAETAANDTPSLTIAQFDNVLHDRSSFSCGFAPIDNFLKSSLFGQIKAGMVKAWIATVDGKPSVPGFHTLGAMSVQADLGPKKWRRAGMTVISLIHFRAVAVCEDMQGKGLGTELVIDAMRCCCGITDDHAAWCAGRVAACPGGGSSGLGAARGSGAAHADRPWMTARAAERSEPVQGAAG